MLFNPIHPVEFFKDAHTYVSFDSEHQIPISKRFAYAYTPEVTYNNIVFCSNQMNGRLGNTGNTGSNFARSDDFWQ